MKLKDLFRLTIETGITADPRSKEQISRQLKKEKDRQAKLKGKDKLLADPERTWNPYGDSRILWGTGNEEVKHLMVGIDIEVPEILLCQCRQLWVQNLHVPQGQISGDRFVHADSMSGRQCLANPALYGVETLRGRRRERWLV